MRIARSCRAAVVTALGLAALAPAPADAGLFVGIGIGIGRRHYGPVYAPASPAPLYAAPPMWTGYGYGYAAPYGPPGPAYGPGPVYAPYAAPAPAYYPPYGYPAYPYRKVEIEWENGMYELEYER